MQLLCFDIDVDTRPDTTKNFPNRTASKKDIAAFLSAQVWMSGKASVTEKSLFVYSCGWTEWIESRRPWYRFRGHCLHLFRGATAAHQSTHTPNLHSRYQYWTHSKYISLRYVPCPGGQWTQFPKISRKKKKKKKKRNKLKNAVDFHRAIWNFCVNWSDHQAVV